MKKMNILKLLWLVLSKMLDCHRTLCVRGLKSKTLAADAQWIIRNTFWKFIIKSKLTT